MENTKNLVIKKWFADKIADEFGLSRNGNELEYYEFVGETEKAFKVKLTIENVFLEKTFEKFTWCPKSCTQTKEEAEAGAREREENRFNRYNALLSFAKENGLKVRNKMKAKTILKAIKLAGLSYDY